MANKSMSQFPRNSLGD